MARAIAESMGIVGLLAVELFLTKDGRLLVNELAPRPHNTYHHSERGHSTSQFEQLVRAVCGLPLGSVDAVAPAAIADLLGDLWVEGDQPHFVEALAVPDVRLHLYGKASARPGRGVRATSPPSPPPPRKRWRASSKLGDAWPPAPRSRSDMFRVARSTRDRLALRLTSRVLATLALGACAHGRGAVAPPALAVATLRSSTGTTIGTATLRQVDGAIQVDLDVRGIADGAHGVHFHTVGRCDAPDFATAGGHLNPKGTKHGAKNPAGPHAGDLPQPDHLRRTEQRMDREDAPHRGRRLTGRALRRRRDGHRGARDAGRRDDRPER